MTLPPKLGKLFLSAKAKASGANLQCATNVVLLDPTGPSAEHGAALENQAIGRAVSSEVLRERFN
jgi:SNF2 family DNA or RNA helicase